jgi:hypothetical protein
MTLRKTGLVAAGLVAAFAVGAITAPTIRDSWQRMDAPEQTVTAPRAAERPAVKAGRPATRARASSPSPDVTAAKKPSNTIRTVAVDLWEPEMRDRAKAVLNPGARLDLAAADFESSEQFMTVAHAARNTNVPFVVLKDRVLNRGQSLAEAIHEFKPDLDEKGEVTRARAAARADLEITD